MRYVGRTRTYTIDLDMPEEERWEASIRADAKIARRLAKEALEEIPYSPGMVRAGGWLFERLYKLSGGRFAGEIEAWAEALEVTTGEAYLLNCSYEFNQVHGYLEASRGRKRSLFGCTAGVRWVKGLGMVHVRSMDWPLPSLGRATRIHHFIDGDGEREFYSVGIAGFVGVLSGMVPGEYSVTMNQAPAVERPGFDFGPAFLLREVLETCDDYDDAVYALRHTPLATSVFFMVCGAKRGQACVIERTKKEAAVRRFKAPVLTLANHHEARGMRRHNAELKVPCEEDEEALYTDSVERAATLEAELEGLGGASYLEAVAAALDVEPVCNDNSYQQMAFCPGRGEFRVWRLVP